MQQKLQAIRLNPSMVFPLIARMLLVVFGFPMLAFAAPSGGRMGGSSFGSSSSSSSGSSSSWGGSGFSSGYSRSGGGGGGLYMQPSFGGGLFWSPYRTTNVLVDGNAVLLGLMGYVAVALLSVRTTVVKLQLAVETNWNEGDNSVMAVLADLARKQPESSASSSSRQQFSRLLSQVSMMLLRRSDAWNAAACDSEVFRGYNADAAEPYFQRTAVQERTKFERETQFKRSSIGGSGEAAAAGAAGGNGATIAVVSLVVALRGPSKIISDIR